MPEIPLFDLTPFHDADAPTKALEAEIMPPGIWKGKLRPSRNDSMILRLTVEHLLPAVMEWLKEEDATEDHDEESVRIDLLKAINMVDGYEMAKDLERHCGWIPDSELVEILEGAYGLRSQAHRKAEKAWVQENCLRPKFAVGDRVECQSREDGKTLLKGQVTRIDSETGNYVVMVPSLGHVPEGQLGTHGFVLEWEKVEEGNPSVVSEVVNG